VSDANVGRALSRPPRPVIVLAPPNSTSWLVGSSRGLVPFGRSRVLPANTSDLVFGFHRNGYGNGCDLTVRANTWNGFSPKLVVNSKYFTGEHCTWVASKFTGTVALGPVFELEVEGEGRLAATKASIARGCAPTRGEGFEDELLAWHPNGNLLTAEILG